MKSYICPVCKEKQYKVKQWQRGLFAHQFDLRTKKWKYNTEFGDFVEHEAWTCPDCDANLPEAIIDRFMNTI